MSNHGMFAAALLARDSGCPAGLVAWNGSDPDRRFAIYRNNVIVSLIDALVDTFPVTQELVGEEFFRGMARLFVRDQPPDSPVLALYGGGFPDFIEQFPPAAGVPYLPDVARLEFLRVEACHAADAVPLTAADFSLLLADEAGLPSTRFILHPSLNILRSRHAVVSLWAAHQGIMPLADVLPEVPEAALVQRVALAVEVLKISVGAAEFISQLSQGACFGVAVEAARATDPALDLPEVLGMLIRSGAIVAAQAQGNTP